MDDHAPELREPSKLALAAGVIGGSLGCALILVLGLVGLLALFLGGFHCALTWLASGLSF